MKKNNTSQNLACQENEIKQYRRFTGMMLNAVDSLKETIRKYEKTPDKELETLEKIEENLNKDEFTIGLFGVTAAGKSTFINALLGRELMKTGVGETSRVITELRACNGKHPDNTTIITYKSKKEIFDELTRIIHDELGEMPQASSSNGSNSFIFDTQTSIDNLRKLIDKHGEVPRENTKSLRAYIQGWDKYFKFLDSVPEKVDFKEIDDLLHSRKSGSEGVELGEAYAVYVKQRTIYVDCPFLSEGMVLLDTPGFGSGIQRHTDLAEEIAKKVDVALIMTKTDYKFTQPDRDFIKKIFSWQENLRKANSNAGYNEFPLEIAIILNQIGLIVPFSNKNVEEQIGLLREKLQRFKLDNLPIFATDAACAFWSSLACRSQGKLTDRENEYYKHYAIHGNATPEENLDYSRFDSLVNVELPKYLAKVKYTSVLGKNLRDISILTNDCHQAIERRIGAYKATAEELKLKRDKFEQEAKLCQEELDAVNTENVPFLLENMVVKFSEEELPAAEETAKRHFVETCVNKKFKFESLNWMNDYATEMINEIIRFITEKLTAHYCNLRNTTLISRVQSIIERYDFSKTISIDSLKKSIGELTLPPEKPVATFGWGDLALIPAAMFNCGVKIMSENFLKNNKENIDGYLDAIMRHHCESFQKDVENLFQELVKNVKVDFVDAETKLFKTREEREKTEHMLSEYKRETQEVFDYLGEVREKINHFTKEQ